MIPSSFSYEKNTPKSCVCFGIELDFATNNNKTSWKSLEKDILEKLECDNVKRRNYFLYKVFKFIRMHKTKTGACVSF